MSESRSSVPRGNTGVLFVVGLALFFGVLNGSAVAVVLPEIGVDLDLASTTLSWVLSGFLLTYGVAIPFYGRLSTRFGEKRLFLIGVTVFAIGSLMAAGAQGITSLLISRTIQAAGGAAVPGLGMALASRAFPEERRGFVLGVISATMGVAAAAGPIVAGFLSAIASWRVLFIVSALAIVSVPFGMRLLDASRTNKKEPLDLPGGVLFGTGVASTLYFVATGSQQGWLELPTLIGAGLAVVSLVAFSRHQSHSATPFIPRALLNNRSYVLLTLLGFSVTFVNLGTHLGLPFLFGGVHGLTTLNIGVALLPAALTSAVVGVFAGRLVDRIGAAKPVRIGGSIMLVGVGIMSSVVGSSVWVMVVTMIFFSAGFALINTPLAAVVSLLVRPKDLAAAMSLNTMMFFVGGSFGATLFSAIASLTPGSTDALNPLHDAIAPGFSNAFTALATPLLVALLLSRALPNKAHADDQHEHSRRWVHDYRLPWTPHLHKSKKGQ